MPLNPNGPISHYEVNYRADTAANVAACGGQVSPPIESTGYMLIRVNADFTNVTITDLSPYTCYGFQVRAVVEFKGNLLPGDIDAELRGRTYTYAPDVVAVPNGQDTSTNTIAISLLDPDDITTGPVM